MKTLSLYRLLLCLSLFSLAYFIYLAYISYFPPAHTGSIRFIGELITLPLAFFTAFGFFFSLYTMIKKIEPQKYLIVFVLNMATIILLGIVTYIQL